MRKHANTNEELEALRLVLRYDPTTGIVTWAKKPSPKATRVNVGQEVGCFDGNGYRTFIFRQRQYLTHRVAWALHTGRWPGEIDHKDGCPANNRIENLRECEHVMNCQNRVQPIGASKVRGVCWSKSADKWQAQIRFGGKTKHIGLFVCKEAAASAYWAEKRRLAGDFVKESRA